MLTKYKQFIRAVSVNRVGLAGVVLTTSAAMSFIIFQMAQLLGVFTNAYIGLVVYLGFPVVFIVGLALIPVAWYHRKRETGKSTRELLEERLPQADIEGRFFGSKVFRIVAALTLLNVVILSIGGSRMLHFMDQAEFCGTACHSVMNPEWVTYQNSPHARVPCIECHVGEGIDALVDSKIQGMWQVISVTFDLVPRPIPTPVHTLRPARETCEKCHWPDKFYGSRLKTMVRYANDSASTPQFVSLNLKIDAGKHGLRAGIHWHVAEQNEVRYASVDDERQEMIWIDARQEDGTFKRYRNTNLIADGAGHEDTRVLDCVDCHNRATHIYEDPGRAVDERMDLSLFPRDLPYLKREAVAALRSNYSDSAAAMEGIRNHLEGFYRRQYPRLAAARLDAIDSAVTVLRAIYNRNIHHRMNITWNAYPSLVGHAGPNQGCFRCHNENVVDESGQPIASDCTLCHSILAFRSTEPLHYLQPADTTTADYPMHEYLRQEFLQFMKK